MFIFIQMFKQKEKKSSMLKVSNEMNLKNPNEQSVEWSCEPSLMKSCEPSPFDFEKKVSAFASLLHTDQCVRIIRNDEI